ncbi:MAG: hypothetical protein EA353_03205 [Puniceicoccaceae bacterium]|nr:MAG: hypothetical protein EA353_03205 [Puniceicoccaceae bacterium]
MQASKTEKIEKLVLRFYDRHSAKRVALATFIVGFLSLGAFFIVFFWLESVLFAALAFLLLGFISINVCFLTIVPPANSLKATRELICAALRDPSRIVSYDKQKVRLKGEKGTVVTLTSRDMTVWNDLVVPYIIANKADVGAQQSERASRVLTASERKYIEQRREEVIELEKTIAEERKSIEMDRKEIEARTADLNQAEEVVITRLNNVEQAEAELEQLRITTSERVDQSAQTYDPAIAKAREAELQAKEAELVKMRECLAEDRKNLELQQSQMKQLKKSVSRPPFAVGKASGEGAALGQSLEEREAALEARMKRMEALAREIEERANFVTESENSLIERLDALSHREANIEQGEINAGIRQD